MTHKRPPRTLVRPPPRVAGARHLTVNNGGDSPLSLAVSDSNLPMAKVLLSQPGGAVGFLDIEVPDSAAVAGETSDTSTVYDLQASYQLNEAVRTWATLGMLKENDVGILRGNSLVGATPNQGSFADDRVIAGSVNLGVQF